VKVGDLAVVVWTEGCEVPPCYGVVTEVVWREPESWHRSNERQHVKLYCEGRYQWLERGDLRVVVG